MEAVQTKRSPNSTWEWVELQMENSHFKRYILPILAVKEKLN